MKTLLTTLTLALTAGASAQSLPAPLTCYNEAGVSFDIQAQSNPRNGAVAQLSDIKGHLDTGGVWLWLTSNQEGQLSSLTEFKTMNGGKLFISSQTVDGPSGCTRVSCGPSTITTTSAKYVANENSEAISFHCY